MNLCPNALFTCFLDSRCFKKLELKQTSILLTPISDMFTALQPASRGSVVRSVKLSKATLWMAATWRRN